MARILIVDDEYMVRYTLRTILKSKSHEIIEAENGAVAMKLIRNIVFDLVILDIFMPEKDGMEVIL